MKTILKLFVVSTILLGISSPSLAQSDPCADLIQTFRTCIEEDVIVCTNTDHVCTAHWSKNCMISYAEYEARLMACRKKYPPQITDIWTTQGLSSGRPESYFESKDNTIRWLYAGVEEYIPGFWNGVRTVITEVQSAPHSPFSPKRISSNQAANTRLTLDKFKKSIEQKIAEEEIKNTIFQADFEQLQKDQSALAHPLNEALAKVEAHIDTRFTKLLEDEKAHLGTLNIPEETQQSSHTTEDTLRTGLPESIENAKKTTVDLEKELQSLFEDKNYIALNQRIYETQLELSSLKMTSPLPPALEIYTKTKEEILTHYLNHDGLIQFTDIPAFFKPGDLQSDATHPLGIEIRHQINRGFLAWQESTKDSKERDQITLAMAYLKGADQALTSDDEISATSLTHIGKTIIDIVAGFIPGVNDLYDVSTLITGILTGKDLLNRPMEGWDYLLTSVGTVIPFLSAGHLKIIKEGLKERNIFIHNPLPKLGESFSRIISEKDFFKYFRKGEEFVEKGELAKKGRRTFITATEDLADITTHEGIIKRLGFEGDFKEYKDLHNGNLYELKITPKNPAALEKFNLQTPLKSEYPNFIGKGKTSGGAREWDMKSLSWKYEGGNKWNLFTEDGVQEVGTMTYRVIKKE